MTCITLSINLFIVNLLQICTLFYENRRHFSLCILIAELICSYIIIFVPSGNSSVPNRLPVPVPLDSNELVPDASRIGSQIHSNETGFHIRDEAFENDAARNYKYNKSIGRFYSKLGPPGPSGYRDIVFKYLDTRHRNQEGYRKIDRKGIYNFIYVLFELSEFTKQSVLLGTKQKLQIVTEFMIVIISTSATNNFSLKSSRTCAKRSVLGWLNITKYQ